jgi:hypothetical protein
VSIQEFHSQLTQEDPSDPIIAALSRLILVEDSKFAEDVSSMGWSWTGSVS